ncbi:MAG: amidohydrolase family protein [Planctomycetes bacterium]|nr:amidohydrolase family protein [Planctomycetota bacterium]
MSYGRLCVPCVLSLLGATGGLPASAAGGSARPGAPVGLAFRVAKVVALDDADTVINNAVVLVKGNEIEAVGPADAVDIPDGYLVRDFREHWLLPGLVSAHNHSAAGGWGDLNDMVYQTNPGLDSRAIPQADNDRVKAARTGGVTSVMLIPGSGTNLAGFGTVVSTAGNSPDEIIMRSPGSLKISQAGNPEWYFGGNGRRFMNWNLRQTMEKAHAYHLKWEAYERRALSASEGADATASQRPEFDPIWDDIRGVFRREYPVTLHTQGYQLMMTSLEMWGAKFGLWMVLDHCTFDGWKTGPLVRDTDAWAINGPRQFQFDRTARRIIGNASGWWKNGVRRLGVNTDAPVIPQKELTYQAAMACWYGWLPYPALRGITNITAKSIGVYDQVGSVEVGKQADLSIWTGDPLDPRSACLLTLVNGKIVYDGTKGLRRF